MPYIIPDSIEELYCQCPMANLGAACLLFHMFLSICVTNLAVA
uniref:Uncharacterized protein n=1 Tax=Arundo donax TaxID=35708 RepID=A0A0A9DLM5_ARUDO